MDLSPVKLKRCIVIGTTRLCVAVLEQLLEHHWDLLSVVSDDLAVKQFCTDQGLNVLDHLEQVESTDFVLFSIANYTLIADQFLEKHRVVLAINYHDSLLPKYAGVNSTTWAIYHGESQHGISWHLITAGIDEGGILLQQPIAISCNETAQSLNLKCFAEALKTFPQLLKGLEEGSLQIQGQDIGQKTYFGKDYLPENYGLIYFNCPYQKIQRLYRSLYFGGAVDPQQESKVLNSANLPADIGENGIFALEGSYPNAVGSLKIWDGKRCYLVGSIDFIERADAIAGYVYSALGTELQIGIQDGILCISKLFNHKGSLVQLDSTAFALGSTIQSYNLNIGERRYCQKLCFSH